MPDSRPVSRIAIIGCGAVVEHYYLPALRGCRSVRCELLVDPDRVRVEDLARRYGIPHTAGSLDGVNGSIQGVVVAVPNHLHVACVTDALRRGLHVLCEKPLGRNRVEVTTMVAASTDLARLYAAMVCRRYPSVREAVQNRLRALIGELHAVDASYGFPLDWPVRSPAYYDRGLSGGGAFLDFGAHLIDALLHLMGDPCAEVIAYADDAEAGVDAEAEGRVALLLQQGRVECTIRASRLRRLENSIVVRGVNGTLEIPMSPAHPAVLRLGNSAWPISFCFADSLPCFIDQLEDLGRAIRGESHQLPDGASQVSRAALIDAMYACRQPLTFSWDA